MTDVLDPRLTLDDVETLVAALPQKAIEELAQGPMPSPGLCRVCGVLRPLLKTSAEAAALFGWHDFFEDTPGIDAILKNWQLRSTEEERHAFRKAFGEWKRVSGMLSYSRCGVIYLAAKLHEERLRE